MAVKGRIKLTFAASEADRLTDLSAVCEDGSWLWLAGDEGASVERLTAVETADGLSYANHRTFALGDFVALPGGADRRGGY